MNENSAGINFLEQDSDWHLIYISKGKKKSDVDAKLENFVNHLNNLYSKEWNTIYLITADKSLINFFLTTYEPFPQTEIYVISAPNENLLNHKSGLKKYENHEFDINIYYRV
ncbi:MAG: hypothetical protein ACFFB0_21340 [Promethearchaeota archaeon]